MPKHSKPRLGPVTFVLQFPEDEETINRVAGDANYTGFPVVWTNHTVGQFLNVPEEETELLAVWFAGSLGARFAALDYFGEDLLKKHADEIAAARKFMASFLVENCSASPMPPRTTSRRASIRPSRRS